MRLTFACTVALAALIAGPVAAQPAPPQHFIKKAIRGDNSEIRLGRLAEQRGDSPGVRRFGSTLVRDHSTAKSQAERVANRIGVTPPHDMMPEAEAERGRLMGLHGRPFDREFVRYMVNDHKDDIRDFREEADAHDGPVSRLAREQLPTLHKHLAIAESLQGREERMSGR
jgi:putative membrane protein